MDHTSTVPFLHVVRLFINLDTLDYFVRHLGLPDLYICIPVYARMLASPGRVAQSVGHLTRKSGVLRSIPGLATYFRFSFRFFKKGTCQLLAKVCARSTG